MGGTVPRRKAGSNKALHKPQGLVNSLQVADITIVELKEHGTRNPPNFRLFEECAGHNWR